MKQTITLLVTILLSTLITHSTEVEVIRRGPTKEISDAKLTSDRLSHNFTAGAGQRETVYLAVDNEMSEIHCNFDILSPNIHDKWSSTCQIILSDINDETLVKFRISLSITDFERAVVRVHRGDESLKPHYLKGFDNPNYIGKHQLILRILDNGIMEFEVDGAVLERHQKIHRIAGGEIIVVGTDVKATWSLK